jgi:hypothetical protein
MSCWYGWRFELKEGDEVDYMRGRRNWQKCRVEQTRKLGGVNDSERGEVRLVGEVEWVSVTDPRIQRRGTITRAIGHDGVL